MLTAKNITVIPATLNPITRLPRESTQLRRVAAYARVSTDSEEQLTSYVAQVDYYTNYIRSRADWQLVEVYTDEGISATNTKRREGFNRMVADALDGKIDLIVTKSVSRFARNTVDSLTTVRKLKEAGVEVYFEKENIWTLDSKGELLITIMSSLAQEESRSISENVTWGQRKRFADGKVSFAYSHGLFNGTSETTFTPNAPMTRGMLAVVLHNLADNPKADKTAGFSDVNGEYFAEAVAWAAEAGIISGYGDGQFGANDPITREQLALMLYRFAGMPDAKGSALTNRDAGEVSDYAVPAMKWAVEKGIISGDINGDLMPKGNATRAQAATVFKRILENEKWGQLLPDKM